VKDVSKLENQCKLSDNELWWEAWHAGTEVFYDAECTSYQTCDGNYGEDPKCSD